jgi:hypothetical protein
MKAHCISHNVSWNARQAGTALFACCALALLLLASGCVLNPPQPQGTADSKIDQVENGDRHAGQDAGLIAVVASMQAHETSAIDGMRVESGQAFSAASGRLCKYITLSQPDNPGKATTRLACQDNHGWFFAPDIFTSAARSD